MEKKQVLDLCMGTNKLVREPVGPRRKYISEVKPNAMGKIQFAHELALAWFLHGIMGRQWNQAIRNKVLLVKK